MLSSYLRDAPVLFLNVYDREEALSTLIDSLHKTGKVPNPEEFYKAILDREKIASTGIGMGVAIPHAKLPSYTDFFIAIGLQKKPGIDWAALDGAPVHLIFLIGGPENRQTDYLKILSHLTLAIRDEKKRKQLFKSSNREELLRSLACVHL